MKLQDICLEKLYLILVGRVSFMDSAGIGMIIGRYKMMKLIGGEMEIVNISPNVKRILEMSGISKIISMKEKRVS